MLLQVASRIDLDLKRVLDLGCGWGIIGLELALTYDLDLGMSDLSLSAVRAARQNSELTGVIADVRHGNGMEPWTDKTFDLIVADVSGVSSAFPELDRWFQGIPADSGVTGHNLTAEIVSGSRNHLGSGGELILPLISLSNRDVALSLFAEFFTEVSLEARGLWLLENVSDGALHQMRNLQQLGMVDFRETRNGVECWTEVYRLTA